MSRGRTSSASRLLVLSSSQRSARSSALRLGGGFKGDQTESVDGLRTDEVVRPEASGASSNASSWRSRTEWNGSTTGNSAANTAASPR